jgi:hypothetical protein
MMKVPNHLYVLGDTYMSHVLLLCIKFLRVLVVLYLRVTCMCRLRHINDSVLSLLKMEGIRLLYFSVHCFPTPSTTRAPTRAYTPRISSGQCPRRDVTVRYGLQGHTDIPRLRHINVKISKCVEHGLSSEVYNRSSFK